MCREYVSVTVMERHQDSVSRGPTHFTFNRSAQRHTADQRQSKLSIRMACRYEDCAVPHLSYLCNLSSLQTLDGAHYLYSLLHSCTHNHPYSSSLSVSLLLPDIRSQPIICTHPLHPSILPSFRALLASLYLLSLPSSSLLSLPDIMSSYYLR